MAAFSSGLKGRLALLVDEASQQWFLVDTGSSYSILPHMSQQPTSGPRLCTADRLPTACWGGCKVHVTAGGRRFSWTFLLADVALPIIGADFLRTFRLLVDLGEMQLLARGGGWSKRLVEPSGSGLFATVGVVADKCPQPPAVKKKRHIWAVPATPSLPTVEALSSPSLSTVEPRGGVPSLQHGLEEFPSVLNTSKVLPKPTHHVEHFPGVKGPSSQGQVGQQQVGSCQEGVH